MPGLRVFLLLLALSSSGLAHASYPFDHAPRATDEELDRMRGGFIVDFNGLQFLLPFSIDGIERLTQINGQTFINGVPLSTIRLNPSALIPLTQISQAVTGLPAPVAAGAESSAASQTSNLPTAPIGGATQVAQDPAPPATQEGGSLATPAAGAGTGETATTPTQSPEQTASGAANPSASPPASGQSAGTATAASTASSTGPNLQVSTQGQQYIIQFGTANSVALSSGISANSLANIIQNSVNDQVIRNITTINLTIEAQMLAAQARLNAILNQSLQGLR